jgi:hypothetical protein
MHVPINVKSPNSISKWQVGFNSAFKGLIVSVNRTAECLRTDCNILGDTLRKTVAV